MIYKTPLIQDNTEVQLSVSEQARDQIWPVIRRANRNRVQEIMINIVT